MALAVDSQEASHAGHSTGTSPLTWSFNNAAGNVLLLGLSITQNHGSPALGAVSYGGHAMTLIGSLAFDAASAIVAVYYLVNPPTGSNSFSVAGSGFTDLIAGAMSFSGANTSSPIGATGSLSGNSTTASLTLAGTTSGNIVVGALSTGTGVTSATAPQTESWVDNVDNLSAGGNAAMAYQSAGGSVTAAWTVALDFWAIFGVEIVAAGGVSSRGSGMMLLGCG